MTTLEREFLAKKSGIINDVGKKVKATDLSAFRYGNTAEIVGWEIRPEDNRPLYHIRFENGECDIIPAGELFAQSGFSFV